MAKQLNCKTPTQTCVVCGDQTPIAFNIKLKRTPICELCAASITAQEVESSLKNILEKLP